MNDTNEKKRYVIRPHHGMCLAYFRGVGYSEDFVGNMVRIQKELEKNPEIILGEEEDAFCACCPNHLPGVCATPEKVNRYDDGVRKLCGLATGDLVEWKAFERLVRERILETGKREEICGDCQWSELCR